jgi:hypothetical protein
MKEEVEHHAREEEEGKLFGKVRKLLDDEDRLALGSEMLAMFEQLMEGAPRRAVPKETSEAAHIN